LEKATLESMRNMLKFYDDEIAVLKRKQGIILGELAARLREETRLANPFCDITFWGWPCPTSPVETCVYDDDTDPAHDQCIYCHNPYERK
jgi:hypothetical protein